MSVISLVPGSTLWTDHSMGSEKNAIRLKNADNYMSDSVGQIFSNKS